MKFREAQRKIIKLGYKLARVKGSHHHFAKPGVEKEFIICKHSGDVHKFCERGLKELENEQRQEVLRVQKGGGFEGGEVIKPQNPPQVPAGGSREEDREAEEVKPQGSALPPKDQVRDRRAGKVDMLLNLAREAVVMWRNYTPAFIHPQIQKMTEDHFHYTFAKGYYLGALDHIERVEEADDLIVRILKGDPNAKIDMIDYIKKYKAN